MDQPIDRLLLILVSDKFACTYRLQLSAKVLDSLDFRAQDALGSDSIPFRPCRVLVTVGSSPYSAARASTSSTERELLKYCFRLSLRRGCPTASVRSVRVYSVSTLHHFHNRPPHLHPRQPRVALLTFTCALIRANLPSHGIPYGFARQNDVSDAEDNDDDDTARVGLASAGRS